MPGLPVGVLHLSGKIKDNVINRLRTARQLYKLLNKLLSAALNK
jgi:hypothetical protein